MELHKVCGMKRAAQILDIGEKRLRRLTKQGRIAHYLDDGGRFKFVIADMRKLARKRAARKSKKQ